MLIWVAGAAALIYWGGFCWRGANWAKTFVKTLSVGALALFAALSGGSGLLVLALGLGAVGDLALSRPRERSFLIGLSAFLLAHLVYIALAVTSPGWDLAQISEPWRLALGVSLLGLTAVMARRLWPKAGGLKGPVLAYIVVSLALGLAVLGLPWTWPLIVAMLAALLFITSDAILAAELFLLPEGTRARRIAPFLVWPSYWMAQALFLLAFL